MVHNSVLKTNARVTLGIQKALRRLPGAPWLDNSVAWHPSAMATVLTAVYASMMFFMELLVCHLSKT
jgi:hypothetical protein